MFSKKSIRWTMVITFLVMLLATPKPAFAGEDCGAVYQNGGNCCGYQDGSNCNGYGYQDGTNYNGATGGSNCYNFQDGTMCYPNQQGSNVYGSQGGVPYSGCQYSANCTGNQQGGNVYAPYVAPTGGTYVVQWGDTMRIIADRLGIPLNSLIAANPQIWNPSLIYAGQVIYLPGYNSQPSYYQPSYYSQPSYYQTGQNYYQRDADQCCREYRRSPSNLYTIQRGDTLKSIAKTYNTTVDDLLKLNPSLLGVPGRIHVGLVITLW